MFFSNTNKKWLLNILILVSFITLRSQITNAQNLKKGFKYIYKNEIIEANSIFLKSYFKNKNCPASNFGLAVINGFYTDNPDHFLSYQYILAAREFSTELTKVRKYKKLKRYITADTVVLRFRQIDSLLLAVILQSRSLKTIKRHLLECKESAFNPYLILLRDSLVFVETLKVNTIEAYDEFLEDYQSASQAKQAIRNRNHLLFLEAKRENTILSLKIFITDFPDAEDIAEAKAICSELAYEVAEKTNTIFAYEEFIKEYPDAVENLIVLAHKRIQLLYLNKAESSGTVEDIKFYLLRYPDSPESSALKTKLITLEYEIAMKERTKEALNHFIKSYPEAPSAYTQIVDSLLQKIDKMSTFFPDPVTNQIAFIRGNDLWLMNENGTGQIQITHTGKVITLACKIEYIFYGEFNEKNLDIYCYKINSTSHARKIATLEGKTYSYFISPTPYYGGAMSWIDNKTLGIPANFYFDDGSFYSLYTIDITSGRIHYHEEYEEGNSNFSRPSFTTKITFNETSEKSIPFFSKASGKSVELFYLNEFDKVIKLTNTQNIGFRYNNDNDDDRDVNSSYFYHKTKSDKILAFFKSYYDKTNLFLLNINGSSQLVIATNFNPDLEQIRILNSNGEPALIEMNENTGLNNLVAYLGPNNEKYIIADNVDLFEPIPH
jgi:hypothetical protein